MGKQSNPKAVPNLETPLQNAQTPVVYPDALPDLYRAGMYAELQKFGRDEGEIRQLLRSSHMHLEDEIIEDWTITAGLDLGVNENKALSALQILLHKTSYQGNHSSERITSPQWRHLRTTPKVSTTFTVAKTLGYLLSYKEADDGLIKLTLNPERCKRVAQLDWVN
ncbi:MAG: hypothetical protein QGI29_02525 [Pirellulales bacterium]|nr:hypothetical protein [Pirellulales bacterium]